jgi:hypothetical protein
VQVISVIPRAAFARGICFSGSYHLWHSDFWLCAVRFFRKPYFSRKRRQELPRQRPKESFSIALFVKLESPQQNGPQ